MAPAKRRRGAQPNNTNALKHGFYSRYFTPDESLEIPDLSRNLADEILLLRVLIRRYTNAAINEPTLDIDQASQALTTISSSMVRLSNLLRTDKLLSSDGSPVLSAINDALEKFANSLDE